MNNKFLHLIYIFCVSITASQQEIQKRDETVLNIVTGIKPLQQLIKDYLDLPDHLIHTIKMAPDISTFAWSNLYIATPAPLQSNKQFISFNNLFTGAQICSLLIVKKGMGADVNFDLSPNSKYLAWVRVKNGEKDRNQFFIDLYDVMNKKIKFSHLCSLKLPKFNYKKYTLLDSKLIIMEYFFRTGRLLIVVYDTESGKQIQNFITEITREVSPILHISENGDYVYAYTKLYSGLETAYYFMIHLESKKLTKIPLKIKSSHDYAILSPDNKYLLSDTFIYDLLNTREESVLELPDHISLFGHNSKYLVPTNNSELAKKTKIGDWPVYPFSCLTDNVTDLRYLKKGSYMVVVRDKIVEVYKNQAFDLDCQAPVGTEINRKEDTKSNSGCAIA